MKKCVLITGCSSGIGRATAFHFHRQGWEVVATMRSPEKETELTRLDDVLVEPLDVTCRDSIVSAVKKSMMRFGKIDVLVNNAGIGRYIIFEEADETTIRETFETNIIGMMWVTQAVLPEFRKNRQGTIINVTSSMPYVGLPLTTLYCASKMAVEGFSNALYYELLPIGIRVRLVQPGTTRTNTEMQHKFPCEPSIEEYSATCKVVSQFAKHRFGSTKLTKPAEVAEVVYEAGVSKGNRYQYISGSDARMSSLMKRFLPDHIFKSIATRMMGLHKLTQPAAN